MLILLLPAPFYHCGRCEPHKCGHHYSLSPVSFHRHIHSHGSQLSLLFSLSLSLSLSSLPRSTLAPGAALHPPPARDGGARRGGRVPDGELPEGAATRSPGGAACGRRRAPRGSSDALPVASSRGASSAHGWIPLGEIRAGRRREGLRRRRAAGRTNSAVEKQ